MIFFETDSLSTKSKSPEKKSVSQARKKHFVYANLLDYLYYKQLGREGIVEHCLNNRIRMEYKNMTIKHLKPTDLLTVNQGVSGSSPEGGAPLKAFKYTAGQCFEGFFHLIQLYSLKSIFGPFLAFCLNTACTTNILNTSLQNIKMHGYFLQVHFRQTKKKQR